MQFTSIGNLSVTMALAFTVYAIFSLFYGARTGRRELVKSGINSVYMIFAFVTLATVALSILLIRSDFSVEYVSSYSNRDLPLFYKVAALWGGQKGSLLFWSWILTLYGALTAFYNRRMPGKLVPYTLAIISITSAFFLILNRFAANPFEILAIGSGDAAQPFAPQDGRGLNPLLQHPAMVIHPPMLYLGYIGFVVPFSFCMAALMARELGNTWIKITRRWTLWAWLFLGTGILLGGKWAYVELGWGGYWAWDPVENASLLPWLTGTAFLHSVIVQERKNMLKVWNVVLILSTYLLSIFGTFLTRSGIVSSVHSFAQSSIGTYFVVFLSLMGAFCLYLLFTRLKFLRSDNELDSYASREASFLFQNLILLASCFAVLWGTIFPVISELIQGRQVTVGAPYFNKINVPIGLFMLFLTGVGPLLAWRKTSLSSMAKIFFWPTLTGIATLVGCLVGGIRDFYALVSFSLVGFVTATLLSEYTRAIRARVKNTSENIATALFNIVAINKRRYGGYIVHLGFVMLIVGFTGKAFTSEGWGEASPGERFTVGGYEFVCNSIEESGTNNYAGLMATVAVLRDGKEVTTLAPEKRFYPASEQTTSEVRIHNTLKEDVYLVFSGVNEDDGKGIFQVWINPLVMWVWIGGIVLAAGTIVTVLPNRRESRIRKQEKTIEQLLKTAERV